MLVHPLSLGGVPVRAEDLHLLPVGGDGPRPVLLDLADVGAVVLLPAAEEPQTFDLVPDLHIVSFLSSFSAGRTILPHPGGKGNDPSVGPGQRSVE